MEPIEMNGFDVLAADIGALIDAAKRKVVSSVNTIMLETYWSIGKRIVEEELKSHSKTGYGEFIVAKLSKELTTLYGKSFSRSNLFAMKKLYSLYPKVQTLSGQLSWSHYLKLLQISDEDERSFYEKECANSHWSVRELSRQINSCLYQRLLLSKGEANKAAVMELAKTGVTYNNPIDIIKDPMVLEFLGIAEEKPRLESDLQAMLQTHLRELLLELGRGFMFVGSQQRMSIGGKHYYVDLVFYNKILKCYVLIDLKMNDLEPENFGQMNLYVNYYKHEINEADDNDPIGIILCASKNQVVAKYATEGLANNIYASRYTYVLPDVDLLEEELSKYLK